MKKEPIFYNNKVVGYIDDIITDNNVIDTIKLFIFRCDEFDNVVNNIKKSCIASINENPDNKNINNNDLFNFTINDDLVILKRKDKDEIIFD